ncbi:hypothetical protein ABZP36_004069 [Zizania latifolia]
MIRLRVQGSMPYIRISSWGVRSYHSLTGSQRKVSVHWLVKSKDRMLGSNMALRDKYQTGAITPLLRYLQRAAGAAVRPPQAPARPENPAPLAAQNDGNVQPPGGNLADPANLDQAAENQEPGAAAGNENQQEVEGEGNRHNWLGGILREVQLVAVGFVASLLPGFQHND